MPQAPSFSREGENPFRCLCHGSVGILDEHARRPSPRLLERLQYPHEGVRLCIGRDGLKDDACEVLSVDDNAKTERQTISVLHGGIIVKEHGPIPDSKRHLRVKRWHR